MPVIGTAGHVDHGKSSLLERLTGENPMHLPEEFERGLTIELGFGRWESPDGIECGLVDVPGHGSFIRNMAGGAFALDAVIFVVAADDGWKPQSEEHLFVCESARIGAGIVALNKVDLISKERVEELKDELAIRLDGSFLDGAPVIAFSALTGEGMDSLEGALAELLSTLPRPRNAGKPKLWVDRSFKVEGTGLVVTGTLTGGSLSAGDVMTLLPVGASVKARRLQMYGREVDGAPPGSRLAINVVSSARTEPARGTLLAKYATAKMPREAWGMLKVAPSWSSDVRNGGEYLGHLGTSSVGIRIHFIDAGKAKQGEEVLARVVFDEPVPLEVGERLIVFSSAKYGVVAGFEALLLGALPRTARGDSLYLALMDNSPPSPANYVHYLCSIEPRRIKGLDAGTVFSDGETREAVEMLVACGKARIVGGGADSVLVESGTFSRWMKIIGESVEKMLEGNGGEGRPPRELGLPLGLDLAVKLALMEDFARERKDVEYSDGLLRMKREEDVTASPAAKAIMAKFGLDIGGFPTLKELYSQFPRDKRVIVRLIEGGQLVQCPGDILLPPKLIDKYRRSITALLKERESFKVPEAKEVLSLTRKYAIPVLEFFDGEGLTKREGSVRTRGKNYDKLAAAL